MRITIGTRKISKSGHIGILALVLIILNGYIVLRTPVYFELLPLLTILASLALLAILIPEYLNHRSTTILLLAICVTLKYIITPLFYCIAPITSFSYYAPQTMKSVNGGILLMVYEMIAVVLTTYYFSRRDYRKNALKIDVVEQRDNMLSSSNIVVFFFVILSTALFLVFSRSRNALSFMALKANTKIRVSSQESSTIDVLLREIVLIGFYSAFVLFAVHLARKYVQNRRWYYIGGALLAALLVTSIIVSEARSSQIYCGYACITLLAILFPENKKQIRRILIAAIVSIIAFLTIYKSFYAFNYSSYSAALSSASIDANTITYNLETYCLGPLHYTAITELGFWNGTFPLQRLLFGISRTVMGTNLLVKNIDMNTTSMVFNEYISANRMNTGFLLPITGVGYFYLSPILAPALTCLVYRIASKLEYKIKNASSPISLFFMAYVYIRVATCIVASNINTILSLSSMIVLTAGIMTIVNKRIKMSWGK